MILIYLSDHCYPDSASLLTLPLPLPFLPPWLSFTLTCQLQFHQPFRSEDWWWTRLDNMPNPQPFLTLLNSKAPLIILNKPWIMEKLCGHISYASNQIWCSLRVEAKFPSSPYGEMKKLNMKVPVILPDFICKLCHSHTVRVTLREVTHFSETQFSPLLTESNMTSQNRYEGKMKKCIWST